MGSGINGILDINVSTIRLNPSILEEDPVRSFKAGSVIQLDLEELANEYWYDHGSWIPFWDGRSLDNKPPMGSKKQNIKLGHKARSATFLVLSDLDKDHWYAHGWLTITDDDGHTASFIGLFLYAMLIKCTKFSEEAD